MAGLIGQPETHLLARHEIPVLAADLIGSTSAATRSLLGTPAAVRHEPPAEIWQYRSQNCVLDVYIYDTVRHAEIRERQHAGNTSAAIDRHCLEQLRLAAAR